jgi:hypothetical protein
MDDGADASREYERLRAELAEFVLNALAERISAGQEPQLSQALIDAIDKRVDAAVEERLARAEWPDPNEFADAVIDAAGGRDGNRIAASASRARGPGSRAKTGSARGKAADQGPRLTNVQIGLLALIGFAVVAVITLFVLRNMNTPATVYERNVASNQFEQQQPVPADNLQTNTGAASGTSGGTGSPTPAPSN